MSFDANAHRQTSLENWEAAAAGWARRAELLRELGAPVSRWMIDAVAPQPGEKVLELAGGLGETGMIAAELVGPQGHVTVSDQAESMLAGARERASELHLANVSFQVLNAEWIDLPLASVDVVLCRWGYMLMADPATALGETRRVLRPGGRLALAVWDAVERNPWASLPAQELRERGLVQPPAGPEPGPFALADRGRVAELLAEAGFSDIDVQELQVDRVQDSFEELWESTLDLSRRLHDAVMAQPPEQIEEIRRSLAERFAPYTAADGSVHVPGVTLVASAVG
jgi:ubiquinone/menaquinone biosynthesis C-methylase UbiE